MFFRIPSHYRTSQQQHRSSQEQRRFLSYATHRLSALLDTASKQSKKLDGLTVKSKISLGYLLAMGIPAVGALSGLGIGNWHQRASIDALTTIYLERGLLHNLEAKVAKTRLAQELGSHVSNPEDFDQAAERIQMRLAEVRQITVQLESSQTQAAKAFIPELKSYRLTLNRFSKEMALMSAANQSGLFSQERIEQRILLLARSDIFRDFSQFADLVSTVVDDIDREIVIAQKNLEQVERLRSQIIFGSVLVSVIVSSVLAIITVQAISRPLESLTKVAMAVSQERDTGVRAEVQTKDEMGTLAIALNQLIDWVNTYTLELKAAQLHLIQTEKMSSVGQLVAGVAHEINNPVNFIHGNIQPIERYAQDLVDVVQAYQKHYRDPPKQLQDLLDEIDIEFVQEDLFKTIGSMNMGTVRIREIVLSLRNFSRLDESGYKVVDIHEGIDNTLLILDHRLASNSAHASIKVMRNYSDLPGIECFPGQLNQVFMNLLSNAIDVLEGSDAEGEASNDREILIATRLVEDEQVQIEIADTGSGMTERVRSRIFDPFFTTKPVGKGTGLGLSISYQIITEQHGGKMTCHSTPGQGTQFLVDIPIELSSR